MRKKLSICICTLPKRIDSFAKLTYELRSQLMLAGETKWDIEVVCNDTDKSMTVGKKRNALVQEATGSYVCFIDDDDEIASTYVKDILEALESNPDAVGFGGYMTTDGRHRKSFEISMRHGYEDRDKYYRYINHLSPVKRE